MYFLMGWKGLRAFFYLFAVSFFAIMVYPLLPGQAVPFAGLTPAQLTWYYFTDALVFHGPAVAFTAAGLLSLWCMGHHTNRDYETFLFTRPRSRRYFLWSEWCVGAAHLVIGFALAVAAALAMLFVSHGLVWTYLHDGLAASPANPPNRDNALAIEYLASLRYWRLAASCAIAGLTGYSLFIFLGILFRRAAPAIWLMVALFLADLLAGQALSTRTGGLLPPAFFLYRPEMGSQVLPPTTFNLLIRFGVALLLPLAAQWLLDHRDV